jgi:hypothetical protein
MTVEKLSGVVSSYQTISSTSGQIKNGQGSIQTTHKTHFRVDNRPCVYLQLLNLNNGDNVTVVGEGAGEITVLALRNDTTHMTYSVSATHWWIGLGVCALLALCGLTFLPSGLIMTLLFGAIAYYCYTQVEKIKGAIQMLSQ